MKASATLGQFEHLVLLAILRLGSEAHGIRVREEIEGRTGRRVTRGALYTTLERLREKGFLSWTTDDAPPARGGIPRRRYSVCDEGVDAIKSVQRAISSLAEGLEQTLH